MSEEPKQEELPTTNIGKLPEVCENCGHSEGHFNWKEEYKGDETYKTKCKHPYCRCKKFTPKIEDVWKEKRARK